MNALNRRNAVVVSGLLVALAGAATVPMGCEVMSKLGIDPSTGGTINLTTLMASAFSTDEREALGRLDAETAWRKLEEPGNPLFRGGKARDQRAQLKAQASRDLRTNSNADVPYEAFQSLARQLAAELGDRVAARAAGMTTRGTLVIGKFKNFSDAGSRTDGKLAQALENFKDSLAANEQLNRQFRFVQFGNRTEAQELINDIGGGSDRWLKPGGENALAGQLAGAKPDTIYLLTGSFLQSATGINCTIELRGEMQYPIRSEIVGGTAAVRTLRYIFHPTLGWISEEQNNRLKAGSAT